MSTPADGLARLAETIEREGGALARDLRPDPAAEPSVASALVGRGPRTAPRAAEYGQALEAIYEGSLLHYGTSRLLEGDDRDLALLAGDRLYALGLAGLVELGDLEAIAELADVISLVAVAHAEGDSDGAAAAWEAGVTAVAWGQSPAHAAAKDLAAHRVQGATGALRAAAEAMRAAP